MEGEAEKNETESVTDLNYEAPTNNHCDASEVSDQNSDSEKPLNQEGNASFELDEKHTGEDTSDIPNKELAQHPSETIEGSLNALPTSETFEEGEGPEMEPLIGEPLSREGSVLPQSDLEDFIEDERGPPGIDPGTPDGDRSGSGSVSPKPYNEKEVEDVPDIDYQDILKELQIENEKLCQQNSQCQYKLFEYLRRKTGDETKPESERDKAVSDQEQRYHKYIHKMEGLRIECQQRSEQHQQQVEELQQQAHAKLEKVQQEWQSFMEQKQAVAVAVLSRRLGKLAAQAEVEKIQASEQRRERELVAVRLENIKLKNKVLKFEATLRAKEELGEGLYLIDFEQLKIENQTYNEKIEERDEELLKLRKKITSTVQVLTHVKEKLQFVQVENQAKRVQLTDVDALVAQKRDTLTRTKQARDSLRMDNLRLRQRCGLLGNETLLRDFEEKVDASETLEQRLEMLKRRHAELILKCARVKKKLEQHERSKPAGSSGSMS